MLELLHGCRICRRLKAERFNDTILTLADSKLEITIGSAGAGDTLGDAAGGDGSPGRVRIIEETSNPTRADVIPYEPTLTGTFNNSGPFPDLGAGFWVLSAVGNAELDMGEIEIATGATVNANNVTTASFISAKTPVVVSTDAARTVHYSFHKMGP